MEFTNVELDMQKREIRDGYKYVDKIYAVYPLLGNCVIKKETLQKINSMAKRCLDFAVDMPSKELSNDAHMFITLATINYAKHWNSSDESKFTKYVTMQFGYKDDSGKIWGIISKSIERALRTKNRFFLKNSGGREFYETVLVHSFGPENSWDAVFDLLFDFLKNNLRWNYIKGDPLIRKMVDILKNRFDGNKDDIDELLINMTVYNIRLGARRLIQYRPLYATSIFDRMLNRINMLVHNRQPEAKLYYDNLLDDWFVKSINKMVGNEKKQISRAIRDIGETALSYSKIRTYISLEDSDVVIYIPTIRLENAEAQSVEVIIYNDEKEIIRKELEVFGNELGKTASGEKLVLEIQNEIDFNVEVKIICDNTEIYDSGKTLYRKIIIFKKNRECSINSLKTGIYKIYIPDCNKIEFENADIVQREGNVYEICLKEDFAIKYGNKVLAMDTTNIQEAQVIEPEFIAGCIYNCGTDKLPIVNYCDSYKIFVDSSKNAESISLLINNRRVSLDTFPNNIENSMQIYEVPIGMLAKIGESVRFAILDYEAKATLYQNHFYVTNDFSYTFNRNIYVDDIDYNKAYLNYTMNKSDVRIDFGKEDSVIEIDCLLGTIDISVPCIKYKWINVANIYAGDCIWYQDISPDSRIIFENNSPFDMSIEFGSHIFKDSEICLFPIIEREMRGAKYNCAVILNVENRKYMIAQIYFSEMFTTPPVFSTFNDELLWDGGLTYIGNRKDRLALQLFDDSSIKYQFPLTFNENWIADLSDFEDGDYSFSVVDLDHNKEVLAQDIQFFGNPNKFRFENKTIEIHYVTEDVDVGSKKLEIKPVYVENIKYVKRDFVPSEGDVFDIYEGVMYCKRYDGTKKYYSNRYGQKGDFVYYQINPVLIIYINDTYLRIVNQDEEGLYCFDNRVETPRYEITDREPKTGAKSYRDILFYIYGVDAVKECKKTSTVIVSNVMPQKESIFKKFETVRQDSVITAPVSTRQLVNAGPGTGKTWVVIERIINLLNEQNVDPEEIVVLCFSRAAVEVIHNRLAIEASKNRVSDAINYVDVRTFDSFASQLLYWVKENTEDTVIKRDIGMLGYDQRIRTFIETVKNNNELISQCSHLFVDEVQDLVTDRARMVLELIRSLPGECGVTLLGDSCQSIYDYQAENENMSSTLFYKNICERISGMEYYTFNRNYRQTNNLAVLGDEYRKVILSGDLVKCNNYWDKCVAPKIERFDGYEVDKITKNEIQKLLDMGTVGILTRTNGQALKISAEFRKKGIEHVLTRRLSDNSLNKWIALIFNSTTYMSLEKSDFIQEYNKIFLFNNDAEEIWSNLQELCRTSADHIGIREILYGIWNGAQNTLFYENQEEYDLTITNIHRGKGREYDTVLIENSIFEEKEKTLEEHKVCYVALTRARSNIYKITAQSNYMSIDKEGDRRSYEAKYGRNGKRHLSKIEVGLYEDVDIRSCVTMQDIQPFLRSNYRELKGKEVILLKDNHVSEYVTYRIIMKDSGKEIGKTGQSFYDSMVRILRNIYRLPEKTVPFFTIFPNQIREVFIDNIVSVIGKTDGTEIGVKVYGDMVTWNVISLVGYGIAEYT